MLPDRPNFCFRLRTWILLILLVGSVMGAERAWRHRRECLGRASYHAAQEAKSAAEAKALATELARFPPFMLKGPCGNPRLQARALEFLQKDRTLRAAQHRCLKERALLDASPPW